jgi:hypothetical protein
MVMVDEACERMEGLWVIAHDRFTAQHSVFVVPQHNHFFEHTPALLYTRTAISTPRTYGAHQQQNEQQFLHRPAVRHHIESATTIPPAVPSIQADSYVACLSVLEQTNEIKTLWIITTERAQRTWTPFPSRELFLILAPCAIN